MNIDFNAPNKCDFIGYLNELPELRKTENGVPYMNFDLDIVRYYDKKDGRKGKDRVTASFEVWDTAAEYIAEKAVEGDRLWVTTSLKNDTDRTVFRVNKFKILKKKVND